MDAGRSPVSGAPSAVEEATGDVDAELEGGSAGKAVAPKPGTSASEAGRLRSHALAGWPAGGHACQQRAKPTSSLCASLRISAMVSGLASQGL